MLALGPLDLQGGGKVTGSRRPKVRFLLSYLRFTSESGRHGCMAGSATVDPKRSPGERRDPPRRDHPTSPEVAGWGRFSKPFRFLLEVAVHSFSPKIHFAKVELGIQISFVGKGSPFPKRGGIGHLAPHAEKCMLASGDVGPAWAMGLCIQCRRSIMIGN